jgi:hypothetical protein
MAPATQHFFSFSKVGRRQFRTTLASKAEPSAGRSTPDADRLLIKKATKPRAQNARQPFLQSPPHVPERPVHVPTAVPIHNVKQPEPDPGKRRRPIQSLRIPDGALVELTGIEPVTPCLQSRCSPS